MSTLALAIRDSSTMLRRNLLHARRYPSLTLNLLLTPVMLLLLFVYVFGGTMSGGAGRSAYLAYLVPGILLMTIGSTTVGTAVSVATDMNEGIIARFRTMAIHRGSVLFGHVAGSVIRRSRASSSSARSGSPWASAPRTPPSWNGSRPSDCSPSSRWRSPGSRSAWG